jgi:hypothetical protein
MQTTFHSDKQPSFIYYLFQNYSPVYAYTVYPKQDVLSETENLVENSPKVRVHFRDKLWG